MPVGAVETDGEGTRALARTVTRKVAPERPQPDRPAAFDARISALLESLARVGTDVGDLDALIAPTLAALGAGLGADRVDFYASNRLEPSAAVAEDEILPRRGGWIRPGRLLGPAAEPAASLDLGALADAGLDLRAGHAQRIEATRPLAPARELAPNLWRPLRSRLALPCLAGSDLLGVLVVESELLAARGSERLLARAESALACLAIGLDRHRLARELDGLCARQAHAERLETLGRVAGGVAHDVNNVLTAIVGYSDLLELELAEGGTAELELAEIRAAADRAGELVEQVLSFGRPRQSGVESIDLCERVERLEGMIGRVLGDGIELDIDLHTRNVVPRGDLAESVVPVADGAFVRLDPDRLERALLNLASNARAALEGSRDPARFRISTERVLIDREGRDADAPQSPAIPGLREGWHLRLTARDNGCGMEPALLERIFEPFFTTRAQTGGSGLGLATIAEVVRESRGGIRVESAPDEGTAFHLYFPISAPASAREPAAPPPRDARPARG